MVYIIRLWPLLISLGTSLGTGLFSALLNAQGITGYSMLPLPPGAPPGWVFAVVWTLLYGLMGFSAYLVWQSDSPLRRQGLRLYAAQLIVNFLWPVFFFTLRWNFFSFLWLLLLSTLVAVMFRSFLAVCRLAAYLQIPYLIWLAFAAYLNLGVFLLS